MVAYRFDSGTGTYKIKIHVMNARTCKGFRLSEKIDTGSSVNDCYTKIKQDGDVHYLFVAG